MKTATRQEERTNKGNRKLAFHVEFLIRDISFDLNSTIFLLIEMETKQSNIQVI